MKIGNIGLKYHTLQNTILLGTVTSRYSSVCRRIDTVLSLELNQTIDILLNNLSCVNYHFICS